MGHGASVHKQGEDEAKQILEHKGYEVEYNDDNSKQSMPDFRYTDGRFLEVTHTKHDVEYLKYKYHKASGKENIVIDINNITRVILEKTVKHSGKDIDLFVFITAGEYNCIGQDVSTILTDTVIRSAFTNVFLCVWDFDTQTYETEHPIILKLTADRLRSTVSYERV